jgi:hypothetical protein
MTQKQQTSSDIKGNKIFMAPILSKSRHNVARQQEM